MRTARRLRLNRETVRDLNPAQRALVAGAFLTDTCVTVFPYECGPHPSDWANPQSWCICE